MGIIISKSNKLYYELSDYYDAIIADGTETRVEADFVGSYLKGQGSQTVLDLACGNGRHSVLLAGRGFDVTGVDLSDRLIGQARSRADDQGVNARFVVQDFAALDLDQKFDAAICMWSTLGVIPYKETLPRLASHIKPGGIFIVDQREYGELPVDGSSKHVERSVDVAEGVMKITFDIRQEGRVRIMKTVYELAGKKYESLEQADILLVDELPGLMADYGFEHIETVRNYGRQIDDEDSVKSQFVYSVG